MISDNRVDYAVMENIFRLTMTLFILIWLSDRVCCNDTEIRRDLVEDIVAEDDTEDRLDVLETEMIVMKKRLEKLDGMNTSCSLLAEKYIQDHPEEDTQG